jgi:hypothetical protein
MNTKVAAEWLISPRGVWEILDSNSGVETEYPDQSLCEFY